MRWVRASSSITRVGWIAFWQSNSKSSIRLACLENTLKFTPPGRTVAPSGKLRPESVGQVAVEKTNCVESGIRLGAHHAAKRNPNGGTIIDNAMTTAATRSTRLHFFQSAIKSRIGRTLRQPRHVAVLIPIERSVDIEGRYHVLNVPTGFIKSRAEI